MDKNKTDGFANQINMSKVYGDQSFNTKRNGVSHDKMIGDFKEINSNLKFIPGSNNTSLNSKKSQEFGQIRNLTE
jgi:hypothetical protein